MANAIDKTYDDYVFLYSSSHLDYSGTHSYIGFLKDHSITNANWEGFNFTDNTDEKPYNQFWMGYLGYEMKNSLEQLPEDEPSFISLPPMWMTLFKVILVYDHQQKTCTAWARDKDLINQIPEPLKPEENKSISISVSKIESNMSKETYLKRVDTILESIRNGELYQANLTRKFFGTLKKKPSFFELFSALCKSSPSPYSSLIKIGEYAVISSTPEQFLTVDKKGVAVSRPIKGTSPRFLDNIEADKQSRQALENSEKDKAENLMIVDLMRNDFSRSCTPGSVKVEELFKVR